MIDVKATERITAMVDRLFDVCRSLDRGDVLAHEAIEEVVGVGRHEHHYHWCVTKLGRRLQAERGIAIRVERTAGYKLLSKAEQLDCPVWRTRRAIRQVRKGRKEIECLPARGLSAHQRRVLDARLEQSRQTERDLRGQVRDQERMNRPTPTLPVRRDDYAELVAAGRARGRDAPPPDAPGEEGGR